MPEPSLFTKEKGSIFNAKDSMMILVKKNTQCCGSRNRKRILGENFIWSLTENGVDSDYIIELNQIFGVIITGRKN